VRILVFHQYYLAESDPGGSRFNEFARLWSQAGHRVTIICGSLTHSTGYTDPKYRGHWTTREKDGNTDVWRCHLPSVYRRGYRGRILALLVLTLSTLSAALQCGVHDVVIASSPPLTLVIPAWIVARVTGAKFVYEVRDLIPEFAVTTGVLRADSILSKLVFGLEAWACRVSDRINVLTPAFGQDLLARRLATKEKLFMIMNGADLSLFTPGPPDLELRAKLGWREKFVVLYAGAHGRAHAVGQLVDVAERLRGRADVLIACFGDGTERAGLEQRVRRLKLPNIRFYGAFPKSQMPGIIRSCDLGVAVLQHNPSFKSVYPNKIFDYMACERPILIGIDGIARKLVCEKARAGVFTDPDDPEGMADLILQLMADQKKLAAMGRNGRAWVVQNAARETLAEEYLEHLERMVHADECH
jgi:glycosyltransferase involved in cell wall biosynthesis